MKKVMGVTLIEIKGLKFSPFYYLMASIPLVIFVIVRYPVFSLSYDEAGQFWMALGQNHSSPMYSPTLGFSEVIKQNNSHNLDPGGFTYLLHFWLMVSKSHLWIKLLPFLFFTGFLVFLVKLLKLFKADYMALLIIPVLFLSNTLPFYGVYLRAYSMEYFGMVMTLYYLFQAKQPKEFYFKAGIVCSLFMWSRYGFCIHILALYLISLLKFRLHFNRKLFVRQSLYFGIPILLSVILMYFITLNYQYIKPTFHPPYLKYMSNGNPQIAMELIWSQIKTIRNLPFFCLLLICLVINKTRFHDKLDSLNISNVNLMIYYFGLYHLVNFILSFLGLYPYSMHSYNTKQYEFFNILSIFFVAVIFITYFSNFKKSICLVILVVGSYLAYMKNGVGTNNVKFIVTKYNTSSKLFASINIYPTARYLIEQKLIDSKYDSLEIYNGNSNIKTGSLVIITQSEELLVNRLEVENTFEKLEGTKVDHSYIYRRK